MLELTDEISAMAFGGLSLWDFIFVWEVAASEIEIAK